MKVNETMNKNTQNPKNTPPEPQLLTTFSDTQLIEELKRRGYEVHKWRKMGEWSAERP